MSTFDIKINQIKNASGNLNEIAREIESIKGRLDNIQSNLSRMSSIGGRISPTVGRISGSIEQLRAECNTMAASLNNIAETYQGADANAASNTGSVTDINNTSGIKKTLRNIENRIRRIEEKLGLNRSSEYSKDPVNLSTGNYIYSKILLDIDSVMNLSFRIFYNNQKEGEGLLGRGWTFNYGFRLTEGNNEVRIHQGDGSVQFFEKTEEGYRAEPGTFGSFTKNDNYILTDGEGTVYTFDLNGFILNIKDLSGNTLTFSYEDNLLKRIQDNSGAFLDFEYDPHNYIRQISDYTERKVHLYYEDNCLSRVESPAGRNLTFGYNENGFLDKVINSRGETALINTYDEDGRVISQKFTDGGCVKYDYAIPSEVSMTEQNGNKIVYEHDDRYRTTGIAYSDGREEFTYNDDNLRTSFTDKRGNISRYSYDQNGNVRQFTNPLGDIAEIDYTRYSQMKSVSINGNLLYKAIYDDKNRQAELQDALGFCQKFEYDEHNRPVRWIREDGSSICVTYDEEGNLSSITNAAGGKTSYFYDSLHRVVRTVDPLGNSTQYAYNDADELIRVQDADGNIEEYKYDNCGNMIEMRNFAGHVFKAAYNNLNKISSLTDPSGNTWKYSYDNMWNLASVTDPCGGEAKYDYDALNRLIRFTDPNGNTTRLDYDPCGNLISRTDPENGTWKIGYDALNRSNYVEDPCGRISRAEYDPLGNVTKMVFPDGEAELCEYDVMGRQTSYTDRGGYRRSFKYDSLGNLIEVSDEQGIICNYTYYPGGLVKSEQFADGSETQFIYDLNENVIALHSSDRGDWKFDYDSSGRVIRAFSADGAFETYEYDAVGNQTAVTDGEGNTTRYEYSPAGDLISVTDAAGTQTRYFYDPCRRLSAFAQNENGKIDIGDIPKLNRDQKNLRITSYIRDAAGNIIKVIDPERNETDYAYDGLNRLLSRTDPDRTLTRCEYYPDGMEKAYYFADSRSVVFEYDAMRQLKRVSDWIGELTIKNDVMGRPLEVTLPSGDEIRYKWGNRGEKQQITYPDGKTATYLYDEALRLVSTDMGIQKVDYSYHTDGHLKERLFPDGLKEQYRYNAAGNIAEVLRTGKDKKIDRTVYHYDRCSRKNRIEKFSGNQHHLEEFVYNPVGNLEKVLQDGKLLEQYEYDRFGNRTFSLCGGNRSFSRYNRLNQLVTRQEGNNVHQYYYDGRGNLAEECVNGESIRKLVFSAQNRLSEITVGQKSVSYAYNGLGQRVSGISRLFDKRTAREDFIYDFTREYHNLLEIRGDKKQTNYFWDQGLLGYENNYESGSSEAGLFLNDARMMPEWQYTSGILNNLGSKTAFGSCYNKQPCRFGIDGYICDPLTGYSYAGPREYDPETGRFISMDPYPGAIVVPLSLNAYNYCAGDPVNYRDPSGMVIAWLAGGIVGAVANVGTKFAGDVVTSVKKGKWTGSSWQSYVGTAAGGFVSGSVFAFGGNATVAGAAGSAVETLTTEGLSMLTGKKGYRKEDGYTGTKLITKIAVSTAKGAASGFAFGKAAKYIKIPGINKGRGSFQAVWKQVMTKANKGQIANIAGKSIFKGIIAYGPVKCLDQIIQKGIKEASKDLVKKGYELLKGSILPSSGSASLSYFTKNRISGECSLS